MLTPKKKRHLTYVTIGIFFLLQGIEYAVILPTLWLYIESRFEGHAYMLGLVLSSFSFAGLISSPVIGRWSDRTRNTKSILLLANIIQIIGSVMYLMGISEWFLVAARFVAGLGSGVGSALFGDIARVTSVEERTAVMSVFMAVRQIGLLLGPGCNLFLRHLHFYIGPYLVDKYTSPGMFMAVLWILHEFLTLFMYWNLPKLKLEETVIKQQQETISQSTHSRLLAASRLAPSMESAPVPPTSTFEVTSQTTPNVQPVEHNARSTPHVYAPVHPSTPANDDDDAAYLTSSNEVIESAERFMGHSNSRRNKKDKKNATTDNQNRSTTLPYSNYGATQNTYDTSSGSSLGDSFRHMDEVEQDNVQQTVLDSPNVMDADKSIESHQTSIQKLSWKFLFQEFVREEIVALLFTSFVAFFNQVGIETLFTPLSQRLLGWGELENSILFCVAGAEVIAVFFLVRILSRYIGDRWLILMGFIGLTATIAVSTWFIPQAKPGHYKVNFAGLAALVFFDVLSLPFLAVSSASLFSKLTRRETQGFAQGIRRAFIGFGTILGPLWAGAMLHRLFINFIIMLVICMLALILLLMSFPYLREDESGTWGKPSKKPSDDQGAPAVVVQPWEETDDEERRQLLRNSVTS